MNSKGFSLIEVVLTLAIIAIIAAYGYQSYQHTRLTVEAKLDRQFILTVPGLIEKAFSQTLVYPSHLDTILESGNSKFLTPHAYYLLSYQLISTKEYKLSAHINPDKAGSEKIDCVFLELHQNGTLLAYDKAGNPSTNKCWR